MKFGTDITCLLLDIGGVLLTDGWNKKFREQAAAKFEIDFSEIEDRHHLVFTVYEEGKLTLDEYFDQTVFFKRRSFTRDQFREFMYGRSEANTEMIEMVRVLKQEYGLKTIVVSNEGRELNEYRIQKFGLDKFIDAFVSSCYVGTRKPDVNIFSLAIDIAQVPSDKIIFIENTAMFVDIAETLGIKGICHTEFELTRRQLEAFGLKY